MTATPAPRLGQLERAVMEHLWSVAESDAGAPGGRTVREVHEALGEERDLAYTTVMTVLDRLSKKGFATRERDGRAWRYTAASSREQLTAESMRASLGRLDAADRRSAMLHFLDDASPDEIADLKVLLAEVEARVEAQAEGRRTRGS